MGPDVPKCSSERKLCFLVEIFGIDTIEGDSPVNEKKHEFLSRYPSTAGHEKSGGNLGGPPPKAKYSFVTDSGQVP